MHAYSVGRVPVLSNIIDGSGVLLVFPGNLETTKQTDTKHHKLARNPYNPFRAMLDNAESHYDGEYARI